METADRKGLLFSPTFKVAVISTVMYNEVVGRGVKFLCRGMTFRKIYRSNSTKTLFWKMQITTIIDWNSSSGGNCFICSVLFPDAFDYRTTFFHLSLITPTWLDSFDWLLLNLQEHVGVSFSEKFWPQITFPLDLIDLFGYLFFSFAECPLRRALRLAWPKDTLADWNQEKTRD